MESNRFRFSFLRPARALFQRVMQWRIVIDASTTWQALEARQDGVGLRRMQVATGRVHSQIPTRSGNLLSRRKTERQLEVQAQPFKRERLGRYCRRAEQGSRRGRVVETCPRQHKRRCSIEAAKRVWLIRPVKAARSIGVTLGMMLGPVVVGYDVIEPIMSKGAIGRGCFQMA